VELLEYLDGRVPGPSLPSQLVRAAGWIDWAEEDEEEIRLMDFGDAFKRGDTSTRGYQHRWQFTALKSYSLASLTIEPISGELAVS
jgi:hypothetical protein